MLVIKKFLGIFQVCILISSGSLNAVKILDISHYCFKFGEESAIHAEKGVRVALYNPEKHQFDQILYRVGKSTTEKRDDDTWNLSIGDKKLRITFHVQKNTLKVDAGMIPDVVIRTSGTINNHDSVSQFSCGEYNAQIISYTQAHLREKLSLDEIMEKLADKHIRPRVSAREFIENYGRAKKSTKSTQLSFETLSPGTNTDKGRNTNSKERGNLGELGMNLELFSYGGQYLPVIYQERATGAGFDGVFETCDQNGLIITESKNWSKNPEARNIVKDQLSSARILNILGHMERSEFKNVKKTREKISDFIADDQKKVFLLGYRMLKNGEINRYSISIDVCDTSSTNASKQTFRTVLKHSLGLLQDPSPALISPPSVTLITLLEGFNISRDISEEDQERVIGVLLAQLTLSPEKIQAIVAQRFEKNACNDEQSTATTSSVPVPQLSQPIAPRIRSLRQVNGLHKT